MHSLSEFGPQNYRVPRYVPPTEASSSCVCTEKFTSPPGLPATSPAATRGLANNRDSTGLASLATAPAAGPRPSQQPASSSMRIPAPLRPHDAT
ncbi:UNVERIFIED_CONTAM: hypothetical protein Slati_0891100 [Sesamum latifolium]|uniref:Uncharacterized protein n=1 Tax=Sesamum latifolium TaxID=2727402 RepID=A0AAW2XQU1_9LAMI